MTDIMGDAEKCLTRDADLQTLKNHLDTGMKDFMDDIRIMNHGIDCVESGSNNFIIDPLFHQWLTSGALGVLNIMTVARSIIF